MTAPVLPDPPRGWSRLPGTVFHFCLAALVLAYGVIHICRPLLGRYDFWAHAAIGRWICENGQVPHSSLFLWTADEPWVYHSWLSQVVFYGLTRLSNLESLPVVVLGFTAVVGLAPFAVAWCVWLCRARPSCWMALPFVIALGGMHHRLEPRPELFTAIFLSSLLAFLALRGAGPTPAAPGSALRRWGVPAAWFAAFVLWGNFHGAVVLGVQVLAVTAVCDFLQCRRAGGWKLPAVLAVLAPLAVCVNPYGLAYWSALVPVGSDRFAEILEWFPVWRRPWPEDPQTWAGVLLPVLAGAAWAFNPGRRLAQLAWLVMFAGMFALARRNLWPFSLTCLVVLAANARALDPERWWERIGRVVRRRGVIPAPPPVLRGVFRAFVLIALAIEVWVASQDVLPWVNFTPARLEYGVVRCVLENQLDGHVFNDYENSSYLQWRFAGRPALYTDLLNAYPDQVIADYRAIVSVTDRGRSLLDDQQVDLVVLTTNRGAGFSLAKLADYLDARPNWARVYAGPDGVVWVRRTPANERVWQLRAGTVRPVAFATLERWGNEAAMLVPAPPDGPR